MLFIFKVIFFSIFHQYTEICTDEIYTIWHLQQNNLERGVEEGREEQN